MKKAFLLFGLLILIRPIIPLVEYVANYDYISKVLCENKAKPELKCNGKCQLMKELANASEEEKPISQDKKQLKIEREEIFVLPTLDYNVAFLSKSSSFPIEDVYTNNYDFLKGFSFFHPPSA